MAVVLVLADHADGRLLKPSAEALTLARRLGSPAAVLFGAPDSVVLEVQEYGAVVVHRAPAPDESRPASGPKARTMARLVGEFSPAAVIIPTGVDGNETAAGEHSPTSRAIVLALGPLAGLDSSGAGAR